MFYEDLMNYRGTSSLQDDRIRGKYAAEMAYYAVLEQVARLYMPEGSRDTAVINNDLLAAARDEMAMRASDQGLVDYAPGTGGLVNGFRAPDGSMRRRPDRDTMSILVRESFRNCEAVRTMVSTRLCSSVYRNRAMTDDEIQAATDRELTRMLNADDPDSPFSLALGDVMESVGDVDGLSSKYGFGMPEHRVSANGRMVEATGNMSRGLKISPLCPELRTLRRSRAMPTLNLKAKQSELRSEDELLSNNQVLGYDPDKHLLFVPEPGMDAMSMFRTGVVVGQSQTWRNAAVQRRQMMASQVGEDEYANMGVQVRTQRVMRPGALNEGMNQMFTFRMAQILSSHSYQDLTDDDFEAIRKIFDPGKSGSDGTIFGDFESDWQESMRNANAYFEYIEHVCSVAEERMPSHEFEIHLEEQRAFSTAEYGHGFVPLMYFTGSRTTEFRKARSNGSRYMAVYPYLSYAPKQLGSLPVMGDVAPASYSGFVITKDGHRGSSTDASMNSRTTNPYASGRKVTADMCASMTEVFDASVDPVAARQSGVTTVRVQRAVGETGIEDLSVFVRGGGSVDGDAIIRSLVDDMNATKQAARTSFQTAANAAMLERVFDRFIDRQMGEPEPGKHRVPIEDAMWQFANNKKHGRDMSRFRKNLSEEMETCLVRELRAANGEDIDSFVSSKHIFRKYISQFVNLASDTLGDMNRNDVAIAGNLYNSGLDALAAQLVERVTAPNDPTLTAALRELYGGGELDTGIFTDMDRPQKVVLKANMLRHASTRLRTGDYDDLLYMLSYSDRAVYEPNASRTFDDIGRNLSTSGAYAAVQLFSGDVYNILSVADATIGEEDVDDERDENTERDESETTAGTISEEKAWFDATFARIGGPDDRSLAWVDRDDFDAAMRDDMSFDKDAVDHAVFVATHPLQIEAMRRMDRILAASEDNYDPARLAVTPQGTVYYNDPEGRVVIKIGPVTDEIGYVMPCVMDAEAGDPDTVEIERPMKDEAGWPVRDENGMELTERARVVIYEGPVLDENGKLMNPVEFCALDTPSLNADPNVDTVPNRFYGISMKLRNYDGYHHETFTDRMSFVPYQAGVLENLDRSLALYASSRAFDPARAATVRSTLYTNVSGSSLRKAYQTNTGVMLDKHMCEAADKYLSGERDGFSPEDLESAHKAANMLVMQSREYRGRCVLAKATVDQNVGLFNQARNLQQGRADQVVGEMDRNSLLRTDCLGVRAMVFQDNPYFDPVATGTARTMGCVAYTSDAVVVDRMTGGIALDPKAGSESRAPMMAIGIPDVDTGGLDTRMCSHPGGQAVDRLELSTNGSRKAVSYARSMKFAMANFGYNMEDGYIVAKRAARDLGHFKEGMTFVPLAEWDKIGDPESGNKGIVAHIVNTDIQTEDGFMADFTYRYLQTHAFNHSAAGRDGDVAVPVDDAIRSWVKSVSSDPDMSLESYIRSLPCDGRTVDEVLADMQTLGVDGTIETEDVIYKYIEDARDDKMSELKQTLRDALAEPCTKLGYWLSTKKAEPFSGAYDIEHSTWQVFMDNLDLDVMVTNVCVCTRSNPSILMPVDEALERDNAYVEAHRDDPGFDEDAWRAEHGESTLALRGPDGELRHVPGSCGRMPMYVDCHYADDKNKDYNEAVHKAGRGYGMQEFYALMAKHCTSALVPYITANDPVQAKQAAKMNRRAMMNGFAFDMSDPDMACVRLPQLFKGASLDVSSEDGMVKGCADKPGYMFVDMDALAARIVSKIPDGVSQDDMDAALARIGESQDFTGLMAAIHGTKAGDMPSMKTDAGLRDMFISLFGQYGGAFALESEAGGYANPSADLGFRHYDYDTGEEVVDTVALYAPVDGRQAVPLFLSNREVPNADGDVVTSPSEDRLQFRIFKSLLGTAVAGRMLEAAHPDGRPYARPDACNGAAAKCRDRTQRLYRSIADERSLSFEKMNHWLKKNMFRTVFPNSLTAVWHGDPALEIDEVGISFEKAKSLNVLVPRKDLTLEQLAAIPDTFEFMNQRYEPITDDDFLLINRSPGQTTGCIRALRPKITGPKGDGITIHPSLATIFDGDFDGDTVGVINPRTAEGMDPGDPAFQELRAAAMAELKGRMSMKANMISKPSFASVTRPDGQEVIHLHPLFIARNADLAVAIHNMSTPGGDGKPACGYNVSAELDRTMVAANMLEQLRQCDYDYENAALKRISMEDARKIAGIRLEKIAECLPYFKEPEKGTPEAQKLDQERTNLDRQKAAGWKDDVLSGFQAVYAKAKADYDAGRPVKLDLDRVADLEDAAFRKLAGTYRDMSGYMAAPPLMTQGLNATDIMYNIVRDANISKKGKEPQLNALLQFSGMHVDCAEKHGGDKDGLLSVKKSSDGKFYLAARQTGADGKPYDMRLDRRADGSYALVHDGSEQGTYEPFLNMSHKAAVSDVKATPFYGATISNIIAQSDKSDATGIGGSMAQKMQKVLGALGYGELALRISGPVTQKYLDAKQNVKDCEKNLKIGKAILNKVCAGAKVNELQDKHFKNNNAVHKQVYNGQYTIDEHGLSVSEYVSQMSNFLTMMGHEPFSPLDRAQFEACMRHYEEVPVKGVDKGRKIVGNPIRKADEKGDMVFASIYNGDDANSYARILRQMADSGRGLYSGSGIYDGKVDHGRLAAKMAAESVPESLSKAVDAAVDSMEPEKRVSEKEAALERMAASKQPTVQAPAPEKAEAKDVLASVGSIRPEKSPEESTKEIKEKMDAVRDRYRSAASDLFDDASDDWDDVP